MSDLNTPIWQLTVGEFFDLQKRMENQNAENHDVVIESETERVYGIAGLAKLFGCSRTTAMKIKGSGVIDKAITQRGRTIIVDGQLALQLAGRQQFQ